MIITTKAAVSNFKRKRLPFLQPLFESITNALDANATEINVYFESEPVITNETDQRITDFKIVDNGDGFTPENIDSFMTYLSSYKKDLGCKGVGRFTWLVVYKNVSIESYNGKEKIIIDFNEDFEEEIIRSPSLNGKSKTILHFSDVTSDFYDGKIDKRFDANLDLILAEVQRHLFMLLFLLREKGKQYAINFYLGGSYESITTESIIEPECKEFVIPFNSEIYNFMLYYSFFECKGNNDFQLCANGRTVKEIKSNLIGKKLEDKEAYIVAFLVSDYLNSNVDDSRTDFSVPDYDLPLKDVQQYFEDALANIVCDKYQDLDLENDNAISEAIADSPYLAEFIKKDKSIIKTKESLLKQAKKTYEEKKENVKGRFRSALAEVKVEPNTYNKILQEVTHIQTLELAAYIAYRQQIIEGLERLVRESEPIEDYLHNLFKPMKTDSFDENDTVLNNIWLLDDKFMSYCYAASDKTLNSIRDKIGDAYYEKFNTRNRPDMLLFYSREEEETKDAIVIEFKGIGADKNEKNKSLTELPNNINIIRKNLSKVDRIWSYIITSIDDDFNMSIKAQARYQQLFSNDDKCRIYYDYFENEINAHVYIVDIKAILIDSEVRNKVFLKMITSI